MTPTTQETVIEKLDGLQPVRPDDGQTENPDKEPIMNNVTHTVQPAPDVPASTHIEGQRDDRSQCTDACAAHYFFDGEPTMHFAFRDEGAGWQCDVSRIDGCADGWCVMAHVEPSSVNHWPCSEALAFQAALTGCYQLAQQLNDGSN